MNEFKIVNLNGVNWGSHNDETLGTIAVTDVVNVERRGDCPLSLRENQFCITFTKEIELFLGEPFTQEECKFGSDFSC
ncbi:hypothetical protein KEM64_09825 [Bacillus velezensis]|uniref:hypothetical protein n=1 Tax=Bacillus velezensis TaxID=492670 RepID=UPI0013765614|nr:hypothetical protein [Bacillus velezensis]MCP9020132.1 hypothetical protein [Bacillus velezensis]NCT27928.1 hypothetical protein [Bacillus velezensis]QUS15662.1 hypothetical protein KEM64_09825 [Bacillus velezensis]WFO93050.1 hypothetical protein JEQ23_10275 [Bacillus velezensis]WFO97110.1 hypothetical protein JEQ24_09985 [Bacillus velezensis]